MRPEYLQIGNTAFYQSPELSDWLTLGGRRPVAHVKREDENPYYTFKSRAVAAWLEETASVPGPLVFAAITDGNLGYAGAELCHDYGNGRKFASIVGKNVDKKTRSKMSRHGNYVIEVDLSKGLTATEIHDIVKAKLNGGKATIIPVGSVDVSGKGYKRISRELYGAGVRSDWRVYVPVGGSELLANLVLGFEECGEVPQFVACTIPENVFGEKTENTRSPAGKLVAEHALLEATTRELMQRYGIPSLTITSHEIREALAAVKNRAHIPTSADSAVAYAGALQDAKEGRIGNKQNVVIINTGSEEFDEGLSARIMYSMPSMSRVATVTAILLACLAHDGNDPRIKTIYTTDYSQPIREMYLSMANDDNLMNAMIAYATHRGNGTLDIKVMGNLLGHSAFGMVDHKMCETSPSCMKDVDDYHKWLRKQENKYGVRMTFENVPKKE